MDTKDKDNKRESTEQTDHQAQKKRPTDGSSNHTATSTRQNANAGSKSASASLPSQSDADRREQRELDHKRESSRLSSKRHQARKRIEMKHLMESQAKLSTINGKLRQENQLLRILIEQFHRAQSTARLPQRLEQERLMQQRFHQVPLHFSQASRVPPNPANLPNVVGANPQTIQSSLNLLNNYNFWQQQGMFGGVPLRSNILLPVQGADGVPIRSIVAGGVSTEQSTTFREGGEDSKPKAQERG